jgi:SAM-dependent methyltransferase
MTDYGKAWDNQILIRGSAKEVAIGDKTNSFDYEISLMKEYLTEPILDAGCGYGRLLRHFDKIIGVDDSILMINEAIKMNRAVYKASITDLHGFRTEFNGIICDKVLQHLPDKDFKKALKEFKRILKQNGRIFITTPSIWNQKNFIFNLRVKLHLFRKFDKTVAPHAYTTYKIISLIEKGGFRIIRLEIFNEEIIAIAESI